MTSPTASAIDEGLLARLRNRDRETLTSLIEEHSRPMYRAARGMGFAEEEAEDLAQDVFVTFLEKLDHFEGRSQVRTWLFGILHRKAMEKRRFRRTHDRHDPIDEVFEERFDVNGKWARPLQDLDRFMASRELGESIDICLAGLSPPQRSAFVFREMENLSTGEICKILDISVTNMSVLLHRARIRLRECIEERGWKRPER